MLIRLSPRPTTGSMLSIYANLGWSWLSTCLSETICHFLARCLSFSNCSRTKRPARPTLSALDGATGSFVATVAHPESLIASPIASAFVGAVEVKQRKPGGGPNKRRTGRYAGRVRLAVVPDRSAKSLGGFIERTVKPGAAIITDDWSGYAKLGVRGYCHTAVAERGDMQIAETFLPIIHLVFSNLKTWLRGIHHSVSPQHLQAYLNEFTFRFNRRFYPFNAFRSLLGIAGDVMAPTYAELYAKKSRSTTTSSGLGS